MSRFTHFLCVKFRFVKYCLRNPCRLSHGWVLLVVVVADSVSSASWVKHTVDDWKIMVMLNYLYHYWFAVYKVLKRKQMSQVYIGLLPALCTTREFWQEWLSDWSKRGPLHGEVPPGSRRMAKGGNTPSSPSAPGRSWLWPTPPCSYRPNADWLTHV